MKNGGQAIETPLLTALRQSADQSVVDRIEQPIAHGADRALTASTRWAPLLRCHAQNVKKQPALFRYGRY
jgi:hypothetical protein